MSVELDTLYKSILEGEEDVVPAHVQAALDANIAPDVILNDGMIAAMIEAGRLFEVGDYFVPEMFMSARAMQAGLKILKPHLVASGVAPVGRAVIGTVHGDIHEVGKSLVTMMLEGAGFEVFDLGVDVKPETFVESVQEYSPQLVAMSTLLSTTMPQMELTIEALRKAGVLDKVKVIVGGAPITAEYAKKIGADGYAPDASQAVSLAKSLLV
ncbi:MAG: corrinoid protein [Chloroflexota bacterium]